MSLRFKILDGSVHASDFVTDRTGSDAYVIHRVAEPPKVFGTG